MGFSLQVRHLTKTVVKKGKKKAILTDVCFDIKENSFVALVGSSGTGKTTLLNAISGYEESYQDGIWYQQIALAKNRSYLKDKIAYVSQSEILHRDLTLYRELWYASCLRLGDLSKEQRIARIKKVLADLELEGKEDTLIKQLSGGEKKRVSIALSLLSNPSVLILDEPTSGLDLNIEKKLIQLLRTIADQGTTIIMAVHTISSLELCDEIIFLGPEGKICFTGTYQDSFSFFGVDQFVDIYERLNEQGDFYFNQYQQTKKEEFVEQTGFKFGSRRHFFRDTFVLVKRYLEIIWNDKFFFFLLFLQALIIALFVACAVPEDGLSRYDSAKIVLFVAVCAAMWIGIFNSVQEVVKERSIVKREYQSNLSLTTYIFSKVLVFALIAFLQSVIFIGLYYCHFHFPSQGLLFPSFVENVLLFFLINFSSAMLGLCISCLVKKSEVTLILSILYMMVQLVFSGVLLPLKGAAATISQFVLGRYAIQGFGSSANLIEVVSHTKLNGVLDPQIAIQLFMEEASSYYTYTVSHLCSIGGLFLGMSIVFIVAAVFALKWTMKRAI